MNKYKIEASSAGVTEWVRLSTTSINAGDDYTLVVDFENENGGIVDVEFIIEDIASTATVMCHDLLVDLTASAASSMITPMLAVRLNVKQYMNGTITLKILQA